jgi:hypothetical protein
MGKREMTPARPHPVVVFRDSLGEGISERGNGHARLARVATDPNHPLRAPGGEEGKVSADLKQGTSPHAADYK